MRWDWLTPANQTSTPSSLEEQSGLNTNERHTSERRRGLFLGTTAIRDFLDPDNHPLLPLIELPDRLNPFREQGVRILAKAMYLLPLLSIKSLPALNMLLEAQAAGKLDKVHTIVENSSGNTAFSLAILAHCFQIERVTALVPWDIAPGKLDLLRLCGVEPRLQKDLAGEPSGITKARQLGGEDGCFSPGQYENEANPGAYEKWVAPQIWEQTNGELTVFAAGMGTTGTLVGAGRYFRRQSHKVTMIGAVCRADNAVPGVRSEARLREIGFDWRGAADCVVEVGTKESFKHSLQLCRTGLMAGPSSGFALAGLLQFLEMRAEGPGFDQLRNNAGEVCATFVCSDTPLPYLDKYSTHLDPEDF
jgi:cysteine synthase